MYFLSRAIAKICSGLNGLQIVQLPSGVEDGFTREVVRAANEWAQASPPFAILVGNVDDLVSDVAIPRVSRHNAIKYRKGDRLAVVSGASVDLASFDNSYRRVVGPGFPAVTTDVLNLHSISPHVIDMLVERLGLAIDGIVREQCSEILVRALGALSSCYERATDTTRGWNGLWFDHVERGLATLEKTLRAEADEEESKPFGLTFERFVWASMGLPNETGSDEWAADRTHRDFMDALSEYWSDYDSIQLTLAQLREVVPAADWSDVDWADFESARIRRDSLLGALQDAISGVEGVRAWADMTLPRFISPLSKGERLELRSLSGEPLNVLGEDSPALLVAHADDEGWRTGGLEVRVRCNGTLDDVDLAEVGVRLSAKGAAFVVDQRVSSQDAVTLRGHVTLPRRSRLAPAAIKLSLITTAGSLASGRVAAKAEASLVVATTTAGALAWPIHGRLGRHVYCGPESSEEDQEGGQFTAELVKDAEHLVAVWGGPATTSSATTLAVGNGDVLTARIAGGADFEISLHSTTLSLQGASGSSGFVTPLTAASTKSSVDLRSMEEASTTVRGLFEEHLADPASPLVSVLGHVVVPANASSSRPALVPDVEVGIAASGDYAKAWHGDTGLQVAPDLLACAEAEAFRAATAAIRSTVPEGERGHWPSRTAWRHLVGNPVLDDYLRAHAALVERCRSEGPMARFWSSFPFSVSIWNERRCEAVLLSPLHPIRLAWLASAEATLFDAQEAESLAGTVEGWQFPCIAASPTPNGRMVAIPADAGEEQVFAAWSMLVPISPDENERLKSPSRALGRPAPGTSPSGLTASAAEAAMRDYLRANPHVPSLTIDLAASTDTARLTEIDEAVIASIQQSSRSSRWWGIRVLDSVHRTGDLPRARLAQLMSESSGARSMTWSRYRPATSSSEWGTPNAHRSNLRLLQDSGAELRTMPAADAPAQIAGPVPLRRFSAGDVVIAGEAVRAAFLDATGWDAFDQAVQAVESGQARSEFGIRLAQSYLMDRSADWTVSGEAFLSPAAMSELVARPLGLGRSRGDRVLWEWRPPYLQGKHGGPIDRRPYVTVARVSPTLRTNLERKLEDVTGWRDERLSNAVSSVLLRLGTEGLGLSSLLTRGGTHESGALGFFLAYELIGRASTDQAIDVVLPIDACETFLTALGGQKSKNPAKRADLLLMRFVGPQLVLVPIEIKFYGSGSAGGSSLPKPGVALKEALGQLRETTDSLRRVVERAEGSEGADRTLWHSAFATLVESGLNLGAATNNAEDRRRLLSGVVAGNVPIRLGHPLVMYFAHDPSGDTAMTFHEEEVDGTHSYGAVIARPRGVFEALDERGEKASSILAGMTSLIEWAVSSSVTQDEPAHTEEGPETSREKVRVDFETPHPVRVEDPPDHPQPTSDDERPPDVDGCDTRNGVRFVVGKFVGSIGKSQPEFWPSNTDLNQLNVGVVGDLGTGKTQLLQSLIFNLRRETAAVQPTPLSMLVLDYKRDFQRPDFLDAVGGMVLKPHDIPLNPFELEGEYSKLRAYEKAKDFCDVLERIYSGVGPVQRQRLTTAVTEAFAEHPETAPTLSEVLDRYQEEVTADSVTSILRDFVMREIFIDGRGPTTSFDELLEDRVVVLALNELGNDKDGKNALVALFLNQYYGYMLRRTKWPVEGRDPSLRRLNSYLLVDEAVNIMRYDFEVLENLLLQGREFGVGVMLSSQFLSHFRTAKKNWTEPLLTWFVHKVPHVTVKDLERIGLSANEDLAIQVATLPVHEALYKSLGTSGRRMRGHPFYEIVGDIASSMSASDLPSR